MASELLVLFFELHPVWRSTIWTGLQRSLTHGSGRNWKEVVVMHLVSD